MSHEQDKPTNKWEKIATEQPESEVIDTSGHTAKASEESADVVDMPTEKLEDQLTAVMEQKINKYKEETVRAQADVVNIQRRADKDISNARKFGSERLLSDLLPVVDGLVRGMEGPASDEPAVNSMREGISLTLDMLHKIIEKHGVQVINPAQGDAFNPEIHEAMTMQPDPNAQPNTILQVLQKGYSLNGRVLRAAMVVVSG